MEQNQGNGNSAIKAGLVLAIALAAIFGYLYFNTKTELSSRNIDVTEKTKELLMANSKLDSISTQLDARIAELTALGGQVEELEALKVQLEKDKKRLIYSKNVSLKEYQDKIAGYETALTQKDNEIANLRAANAQLEDQNMTLTTTVSTLETEKEELASTKAALTDSVYSYSAKNKELSEKVSLASALKPMSYNVSAINSRGRERDGEEFKAKRVEKIKLSFTLAENPLTKKENKTVYMRMLDPTGSVISDMATGSGSFNFGGKETVYTAKQNIMFTNTGQTVDFIYDRGASYESGEYKVELYSEGYRIGQTSFNIK
jgi:myosin heavy subunit